MFEGKVGATIGVASTSKDDRSRKTDGENHLDVANSNMALDHILLHSKIKVAMISHVFRLVMSL